MFTEAVRRQNTIIIIEMKSKSRVVTFKAGSDLVRSFDILIKRYNLGTRSNVLKKLMEALARGLERVGNGIIRDISLRINYIDDDGDEKSIDVSIKP